MEKQVDGAVVVDSIVFSKEELSFGDCLPKEEVVLEEKVADSPPATEEKRLSAASQVFDRYAQNRSRVYPDMIMRDLSLVKVAVGGREGIIELCASLQDRFDVREEDRMFIFSKRKSRTLKFVAFGALGLVVLAVGALVTVSLASSGNHEQGGFVDRQGSSRSVPVQSPAEVFETEDEGPGIFKGLSDSVESLLASESFSAAISMLQSSAASLDDDFVKRSRARINLLVSLKADSLQRSIDELLGRGKYQEAFELEQRFDKDVFRLAGGGTAQRLRQRLITDWVRSYKGWYSKEEAVESVTSEIQRILGSRSYRVAEGDGGVFYLEYGPIKDGV